jgi:hypothetical protein
MSKAALLALADRVARMRRQDNAVDVLCDVALFTPTRTERSVRSNAAGTKVIYTTSDGDEHTYWPYDWTTDDRRKATAAALRAIAAQMPDED